MKQVDGGEEGSWTKDGKGSQPATLISAYQIHQRLSTWHPGAREKSPGHGLTRASVALIRDSILESTGGSECTALLQAPNATFVALCSEGKLTTSAETREY